MANTPDIILGEANLKAWVNSVDPNNMLNRQVRGHYHHHVYQTNIRICSKFNLLCEWYRTVCLFYFGRGRTQAIIL